MVAGGGRGCPTILVLPSLEMVGVEDQERDHWRCSGPLKISWLVGIGARLRCAPSGRGRWSPVEERELEKIRRGEQSQSSRARRAVRGFNLPPTEPRSGGSSYIRRSQILHNASVNLEILSLLRKQNLADFSNMPHDGKRSSEMNEAPLFNNTSLIHTSPRSMDQ